MNSFLIVLGEYPLVQSDPKLYKAVFPLWRNHNNHREKKNDLGQTRIQIDNIKTEYLSCKYNLKKKEVTEIETETDPDPELHLLMRHNAKKEFTTKSHQKKNTAIRNCRNEDKQKMTTLTRLWSYQY